jgi:hypothetical protein
MNPAISFIRSVPASCRETQLALVQAKNNAAAPNAGIQ